MDTHFLRPSDQPYPGTCVTIFGWKVFGCGRYTKMAGCALCYRTSGKPVLSGQINRGEKGIAMNV